MPEIIGPRSSRHWCRLNGPPQIRSPDELESLVERVVATWDSGERDRAACKLADALELAECLGYT